MTQDENDDPSEEEEPVAKVSHKESITLESKLSEYIASCFLIH